MKWLKTIIHVGGNFEICLYEMAKNAPSHPPWLQAIFRVFTRNVFLRFSGSARHPGSAQSLQTEQN